MEKQASSAEPAHSTNDSFRPSFDANGPVDAHARPKVDYLTENEVMGLVIGAKHSRNPERDQLLIFMLFRHGYRESEAVMSFPLKTGLLQWPREGELAWRGSDIRTKLS